MSKPSSAAAVEAALHFLRGVTAECAASMPATIDYPALATHAAARGFQTDADAIEHAFRILMRVRNTQLAHIRDTAR